MQHNFQTYSWLMELYSLHEYLCLQHTKKTDADTMIQNSISDKQTCN